MKETDKMLEIIHENCRKQKVAKFEREVAKKENHKKRILITVLVVAFIAVLVMFDKYNESQIKNCMEAGHSENFCRYAGE